MKRKKYIWKQGHALPNNYQRTALMESKIYLELNSNKIIIAKICIMALKQYFADVSFKKLK